MITKISPQTIEWNISAPMSISYSVVERSDLFSADDPNVFGDGSLRSAQQRRRLVIIDRKVNRFFGDQIRAYFARHNMEAKFVLFRSSEQYKTKERLFAILKAFDEFKLLRRSEPVVAVGGGVLLDTVGLAASLFRRGIPYIRVPTTLMGLVDAGIGVKTGIDFHGHKNLIGTYYQPVISYIDLTFLRSLDQRQISNGLAEILKVAIIKDESLFLLLEQYGRKLLKLKLQDPSVSRIVLHKAINGMLEELEPNLWESNLERLVDFGHTFSAALEMKALPNLLHGEAVSIDMALVAVLAYRRKLLGQSKLLRIISVLQGLGLPTFHDFCEPDLLYSGLIDTTLHRDGLQRFPIPTGIGRAQFINDVSYDEIRLAACTLRELSNG